VSHIVEKAYEIAQSYVGKPGIVAVFIGGSIAQGTAWKYSDLELGLLVEQRFDDIAMFNLIDGMGVEIHQIEQHKVVEFLDEYNSSGDFVGVKKFPIQFYQSKIVSDPTGLWTQFKAIYDRHLLADKITILYKNDALKRSDERLTLSKSLLAENKPNSALAALRLAINELMLAYYWKNKIRPRSMHRTVQLLHEQSPILGGYELYDAFTRIYGIEGTQEEMRQKILTIAPEVYGVCSARWGEAIPVFFENTATRQVRDGQNISSIVFHYKWCVHTVNGKFIAHGFYDTTEYRAEQPLLYAFLGFEKITIAEISSMINQHETVRSKLR